MSRHRHKAAGRYPRVARVNELLREVVAEELERLSDMDERLGLLTVTGVEADPDLRHATVLLDSLSDESEAALAEARARIQGAVAHQVRMARTPRLAFSADPAVQAGERIDALLRNITSRPSLPTRAPERGE